MHGVRIHYGVSMYGWYVLHLVVISTVIVMDVTDCWSILEKICMVEASVRDLNNYLHGRILKIIYSMEVKCIDCYIIVVCCGVNPRNILLWNHIGYYPCSISRASNMIFTKYHLLVMVKSEVGIKSFNSK
jgi:hypothetical protein